MSRMLSVDLVRSAHRSPGFPKDWTDEDIRRELARYERFLLLAQRHPSQPLAPTRGIDEMWHLHMMHPRAYLKDCLRLFGDVLDHDGGFGSDPDELPQLQAVFGETARLWELEFGEPYVSQADDPRVTNCWHDCQGRCWHACKSEDENDDSDEKMLATIASM